MTIHGSKEYGGMKEQMVREKAGRKEKEKNERKGNNLNAIGSTLQCRNDNRNQER